jgi:hypothetical protein
MPTVVAYGESDCERIGSGVLTQPVNAVSSLAYVAAAAAVLVPARETAGARRVVLTAYAASLAAVGLGSLAYHGPQPAWAGRAHDASIGVALMLALVVATMAPAAQRWRRPAGKLFGGLVVLAALAYAAGRTGSPLCAPDSPLQPHAIWHLLSAASAVTLAEISGTSHARPRSELGGHP